MVLFKRIIGPGILFIAAIASIAMVCDSYQKSIPNRENDSRRFQSRIVGAENMHLFCPQNIDKIILSENLKLDIVTGGMERFDRIETTDSLLPIVEETTSKVSP